MRKASRLFEIIQILRLAKKPMTAAVMAERLEVTVRSIYRDIAALQAMRMPIEGGRGIAGIRERVALYGGEVAVGPRGSGGFEVSARFPVREP